MSTENNNINLELNILDDNTSYAKNDLAEKMQKILYAWGLHWQSVVTTLAVDNGMVDTGRYVGSLSFITPSQQSGGEPVANSESDDILSGLAQSNTLTVGSNVEYASILEDGTSRMAARPVVGNALLYYKDEYENLAKQILKA